MAEAEGQSSPRGFVLHLAGIAQPGMGRCLMLASFLPSLTGLPVAVQYAYGSAPRCVPVCPSLTLKETLNII